MSKNKKQHKYCNCQTSSDNEILKPNVNHSFCEKCGCVLIKNHEETIYFTLKPKQKRQPYDLSPIELIRHMKKKTEEKYPHIYEEFNLSKNDDHIKEKAMKSLNIYLKYRKMILIKLQKLMKIFDYCDVTFYQTLFFLDTYLSHKMTEDISEKTILYYLVGYFLCAVKIKETDIYEPSLDSFFDLSKGIYLSTSKIAYYEVRCLKSIHYNIFSYSAYDWISQLISNGVVFNCEVNNNNEVIMIRGHRHSLVNTINKYALKLLINLTNRIIFFKYSPMHVAISLIQITREKYINKAMIKQNLFLSLINLYGIKFDDYKKCYEEIKAEIKEMNSESDIYQKEIDNINGKEIDEHIPELKDHERNESTKKPMKIGKNIYVPNKLKSSNALIRVTVNSINNNRYENSPNKINDESNKQDSKEKENKEENLEIELSLNEAGTKKKYKIKSQKNNITIQNQTGRLSIDCNTNIFRSNQNLPHVNLKSRERHSFITMNNEDTTDSKHSKNFSLSKKKIKPIIKEIAHVRADHERYHSINSKEMHNNSSLATSVEKDKEQEIERPNIKKKSKFFTASNKNAEINNLDDNLPRNNIRTSTKLPIISGFENLNHDRIDTNIGEQNNHNHHNHHKTKKHYRLKTHIANAEIKDNPLDEDIKDSKNKIKLIEVL